MEKTAAVKLVSIEKVLCETANIILTRKSEKLKPEILDTVYLPVDGTVHEISTKATLLLEKMMAFSETIGHVLVFLSPDLVKNVAEQYKNDRRFLHYAREYGLFLSSIII